MGEVIKSELSLGNAPLIGGLSRDEYNLGVIYPMFTVLVCAKTD